MRADQEKVMNLLKNLRGQVEGIINMVEEDLYCVDISNQLLAAQGMVRKINHEILAGHIRGCVKEALLGIETDKKIDEVLLLLERMGK